MKLLIFILILEIATHTKGDESTPTTTSTTPRKTPTRPTICPMEKGYCVSRGGYDQNSGVIKLNSVDGNTAAAQAYCLKMSLMVPEATGCEVIWNQRNRGCYVHTHDVARGNNVDKHSCWVFSKCTDILRSPTTMLTTTPATPRTTSTPTICPMEKGYCVSRNGNDQNSGVIKLNSVDGNTEAAREYCLKICLMVPGAKGCEEIWHQRNRGCYVHTHNVARGNNVGKHSCWIFSKCAVHPCDNGSNGGCTQICNRRKDKSKCSCKTGFVLANDGRTCNEAVVPNFQISIKVMKGYTIMGFTHSLHGLPGSSRLQRIYGELKLHPTKLNATFVPINCVARPTPKKISTFCYDIMRNGKPVDPTFIRHSAVDNNVYRFSISPFNVVGISEVYIQCKSLVTCKCKATVQPAANIQSNVRNELSYYTVESTTKLRCAFNGNGMNC